MIDIIPYDENTSWVDLFCDYMLKNLPCILSSEFTNNWRARKYWVSDGNKPNYGYLLEKFGMLIFDVLIYWRGKLTKLL